MSVDMTAWQPQLGEQVSLVGSGPHGDFMSVQRVIEIHPGLAYLTSGWAFARKDDEWFCPVPDIAMMPAPQINPDIHYPSTANGR